ncbi:MAG TPA: hypothetical protein P5569_04065, partial [Candidatus Latescibacteria bacterium]|nr:hypothetical protein [Candidatus Latescibacterota bacterium]
MVKVPVFTAELFPNTSTDQTSYEYPRFERREVNGTACCRVNVVLPVSVIAPPVNPYRTIEVESL